MVIYLFYSFTHGIAVKNRHLYAGEKVVDEIARCKNCNGVIFLHFVKGFQSSFSLGLQIIAFVFYVPCRLIATTKYFFLERTQNGVGIIQ